MNTVVQLRPSQSEKPTVRGGRAKNADYRQREYLTEAEIEKLKASLLCNTRNNRNPHKRSLVRLLSPASGVLTSPL